MGRGARHRARRRRATPTLTTWARDFADNLWSREPLDSLPLRWARALGQLAIVIGEGFVRDQLLLRAHSLTYLTVLSVVPLLALAGTLFALLGDPEELTRQILDLFTPQVADQLLPYVNQLDFRGLGTFGGPLLVGTTILMLGSVERSLNAVWGVKKQRPWRRRIPDYLAVLLVAPLLLGVAIPMAGALESQWMVQKLLALPGFDVIYNLGLRQLPTLLFVLAFSFLYWFLPNTEVRPLSALLGGAVGGFLFTIAQQLYLGLNVGAAKYGAIFGALSWIALFMVWVYFCWAIVLFGAEVAYAHQTLARYRREVRGAQPGPAARESIGMAIALVCAQAFRDGAEPWTPDRLSDALDVPLRTVRDVVEVLERAGILSPCGGEHAEAVQLGRPSDRVHVADVLAALRGPRPSRLALPEIARQVEVALTSVDEAAGRVAEEHTLRDLLESLRPEASEDVPSPAPSVDPHPVAD